MKKLLLWAISFVTAGFLGYLLGNNFQNLEAILIFVLTLILPIAAKALIKNELGDLKWTKNYLHIMKQNKK